MYTYLCIMVIMLIYIHIIKYRVIYVQMYIVQDRPHYPYVSALYVNVYKIMFFKSMQATYNLFCLL